jgi:peptidoglycan L-alanyl-D-glutamate endopeptidase CwlK
MINSRKIDDLHPKVAATCRELIARCDAAGIDIIVTSTYRDNDSQRELYAQGRTKPGRKVTNARPGYSWHNWRLAFDVVPMRAGKPVWGTTGDDLVLWQTIGKIGKEIGLEWAGDWVSFREYPHFQYTGGLTLDDLNAGKKIPF